MSEENIALLWLLGIPLPRFARKRNFVPPRAANWHGQANHFCFSEIDVKPGVENIPLSFSRKSVA